MRDCHFERVLRASTVAGEDDFVLETEMFHESGHQLDAFLIIVAELLHV